MLKFYLGETGAKVFIDDDPDVFVDLRHSTGQDNEKSPSRTGHG